MRMAGADAWSSVRDAQFPSAYTVQSPVRYQTVDRIVFRGVDVTRPALPGCWGISQVDQMGYQ